MYVRNNLGQFTEALGRYKVPRIIKKLDCKMNCKFAVSVDTCVII